MSGIDDSLTHCCACKSALDNTKTRRGAHSSQETAEIGRQFSLGKTFAKTRDRLLLELGTNGS